MFLFFVGVGNRRSSFKVVKQQFGKFCGQFCRVDLITYMSSFKFGPTVWTIGPSKSGKLVDDEHP